MKYKNYSKVVNELGSPSRNILKRQLIKSDVHTKKNKKLICRKEHKINFIKFKMIKVTIIVFFFIKLLNK